VLYEYGRDYGSNVHLITSIILRQKLLDAASSDDERSIAQDRLGIALWRLGERESGTGLLEEAVAAFRAALEEYTRARVPLQWAETQNNLGSALGTLGERESGTARLEEAIAAFRAALEERTRARVPLDWATTQNNLGNALKAPRYWDTCQSNLERVLKLLEERTTNRNGLAR
jgi:tetratricopeptide (TPR) repeat protein